MKVEEAGSVPDDCMGDSGEDADQRVRFSSCPTITTRAARAIAPPAARLGSTPLTAEALRTAETVLILTHHSSIDRGPIVWPWVIVVNTRHATRYLQEGREKVLKA